MNSKIFATPSVLKWARSTAGLTIDDVAEKISQTPDYIREVEIGSAPLTYSQLNSLAYEVYKRPLAVFFYPEPPEEFDTEQEFRTILNTGYVSFDKDTRFIIRNAKFLQLSLYELYDGESIPSPSLFRIQSFKPDENFPTQVLRDALGITLDTQKSFGSPEIAFKRWRTAVEDIGIYVFKDSFKNNQICGFSIYDESFPIIYINNKNTFTRQVFTMIHELCHILLKCTSMTFINQDYIERLNTKNKEIEIYCNKFTSKLLVPEDDFIENFTGNYDDHSIFELSRLYSVSREVILRRLLDNGIVDYEFYNSKSNEWQGQVRKRKLKPGGNSIKTKISYLGDKYLTIVIKKYHQGRIPQDQLASFFNTKTTDTAYKVHDAYMKRLSII